MESDFVAGCRQSQPPIESDAEQASESSEDENFDCGSSCSSLSDRLQKMRPISCSAQLRQFDRHRFEAHNWRLLTMRTYRRLQSTVDGVQQLLQQASPSSAGRDPASGWITKLESASITASFGCHAKPVLMVCGAPTSGKSTLINCLLDHRVLPIRFGQEDKGIIRIVYSPKFYVRFRGLNLQVEPSDDAKTCRGGGDCASHPKVQPDLANVVRDFIEDRMTEKERLEWSSLKENCWLEIGVDCPLLQSGFSIMEVPECLREDFLLSILNQQEHSLYQTLVFVLDGMNGISQMVREFLLRLKNQCTNLSILYVINKIDFSPEALKRDDVEPDSDSDDDKTDDEFECPDDDDECLRRNFPKGRLLEENNAKRALNILTKTLGIQGLQGLPDRAVLVSLLRWNRPLKEVSPEIAERNLLYKQRYKELEAELDSMLRAREMGVFHLSAEMLRTASMRLYRTFTAGHRLLHPDGQLNNQEALNQLTSETKKIFREVWQYMKDKRRSLVFTVDQVYRREKQEIIDWCVDQPMNEDGSGEDAATRERIAQLVQDLVVRRLQSRFEELLRAPLQDIRQTLLEKLTELQARISGLSYCQQTAQMLGQSVADKASHGISQLAQLTLTVQIRRRPGRLLSVVRFFRDAADKLARPSGGKDASLTGRELIRSLAETSYDSIEVNWMTQRLFQEAEDRLRQTEAAIMGMVTSRLQYNSGLQKLLARSVPEALRLWQDAQLCVAAADALANVARHGPLRLDTEDEVLTYSEEAKASLAESSQLKLGPSYRLAAPYAGFSAHDLVATVTGLWNFKDSNDDSNNSDEDEATLSRWRSSIGGLLNHLLLATASSRSCTSGGAHYNRGRHLAVTKLLTFTEANQLCALHLPIGMPISQLLQESTRLSDVQTYELIDGMCGALAQLSDSLPAFVCRFEFTKLRVSVWPSSRTSVVYSLLEDQIDFGSNTTPSPSSTSAATLLMRGGNHHQLLDWAVALLLKSSASCTKSGDQTAQEVASLEELRTLLTFPSTTSHSTRATNERRDRLKALAVGSGRRLTIAVTALYQQTQLDDLIQELRLLIRRELSALRTGVSTDRTKSRSTSTASACTSSMISARRSPLTKWIRFDRRMRSIRERALAWACQLDDSLPGVARGEHNPAPPPMQVPLGSTLNRSIRMAEASVLTEMSADSSTLTLASSESTQSEIGGVSPVLAVTGCSRQLQFGLINRLLRQRVLPPTDEDAKNRQLGAIKLCYSESQRIELNRCDRPYFLPLRAAAAPDGSEEVDVVEQVVRFVDSLPDDTSTAWTGLNSKWLKVQIDNPVLKSGLTLLAPPEHLIRLGKYEQLKSAGPVAVLCVTEEPPTVSELHHILSLQVNLQGIPILAIHCQASPDSINVEPTVESSQPLRKTLPPGNTSPAPRLRRARYRLSGFSASEDLDEDTIGCGSMVCETQLLLDKRLDSKRIRRLVLPTPCVVGGFFNEDCCAASECGDAINVDSFSEAEACFSQDTRLDESVIELLEEANRSESEQSLLRLQAVSSRLLECFVHSASSESPDLLAANAERLKARIACEFQEVRARLDSEKSGLKNRLEGELASIRPLVVDDCGRVRLDDHLHHHQQQQQQQQQQLQKRMGQTLGKPILDTVAQQQRDAICRAQIEVCALSSCAAILKRAANELAASYARRLAERLLSDNIHGNDLPALLSDLSADRVRRALQIFLDRDDWDAVPMRWQAVNPGADSCLKLSIGKDWKTLTADETFSSIDVPGSTKRILEHLAYRIQAAETAIVDLINNRLQFSRPLQKLMAKSAPEAVRLWQDAQLCAAASDALSSVAKFGPLQLATNTERAVDGPLGSQFKLNGSYANLGGTDDPIVATVTCLWDCGVGAGDAGACDVDEAAVSRWRSGLGGLLNHLLLPSNFSRANLAVTRLLTFNDGGRLCALHPPLGNPLADALVGQAPSINDVQACEIVDGLCGAFTQLTESLPASAWSFDCRNFSVVLSSEQQPSKLLFDLLHQSAINFKTLTGKPKRSVLKHQEAGSSQGQQQHLVLLDLCLLVLLAPRNAAECRQLLSMDDVKVRRSRIKNLAKADVNQQAVESSFLLKRLISFYQEKPNEVCASVAAAVRRELSYRRGGLVSSGGSSSKR